MSHLPPIVWQTPPLHQTNYPLQMLAQRQKRSTNIVLVFGDVYFLFLYCAVYGQTVVCSLYDSIGSLYD